jgi:hypothetical protein
MHDGHDEASGSSSDVDDATETKVLVISSSDPAPACGKSIVSETDLLFPGHTNLIFFSSFLNVYS